MPSSISISLCTCTYLFPSQPRRGAVWKKLHSTLIYQQGNSSSFPTCTRSVQQKLQSPPLLIPPGRVDNQPFRFELLHPCLAVSSSVANFASSRVLRHASPFDPVLDTYTRALPAPVCRVLARTRVPHGSSQASFFLAAAVPRRDSQGFAALKNCRCTSWPIHPFSDVDLVGTPSLRLFGPSLIPDCARWPVHLPTELYCTAP